MIRKPTQPMKICTASKAQKFGVSTTINITQTQNAYSCNIRPKEIVLSKSILVPPKKLNFKASEKQFFTAS